MDPFNPNHPNIPQQNDPRLNQPVGGQPPAGFDGRGVAAGNGQPMLPGYVPEMWEPGGVFGRTVGSSDQFLGEFLCDDFLQGRLDCYQSGSMSTLLDNRDIRNSFFRKLHRQFAYDANGRLINSGENRALLEVYRHALNFCSAEALQEVMEEALQAFGSQHASFLLMPIVLCLERRSALVTHQLSRGLACLDDARVRDLTPSIFDDNQVKNIMKEVFMDWGKRFLEQENVSVMEFIQIIDRCFYFWRNTIFKNNEPVIDFIEQFLKAVPDKLLRCKESDYQSLLDVLLKQVEGLNMSELHLIGDVLWGLYKAGGEEIRRQMQEQLNARVMMQNGNPLYRLLLMEFLDKQWDHAMSVENWPLRNLLFLADRAMHHSKGAIQFYHDKAQAFYDKVFNQMKNCLEAQFFDKQSLKDRVNLCIILLKNSVDANEQTALSERLYHLWVSAVRGSLAFNDQLTIWMYVLCYTPNENHFNHVLSNILSIMEEESFIQDPNGYAQYGNYIVRNLANLLNAGKIGMDHPSYVKLHEVILHGRSFFDSKDADNPYMIYLEVIEKAKAANQMFDNDVKMEEINQIIPSISLRNTQGTEFRWKINLEYWWILANNDMELPQVNFEDLQNLFKDVELWAESASEEEWVIAMGEEDKPQNENEPIKTLQEKKEVVLNLMRTALGLHPENPENRKPLKDLPLFQLLNSEQKTLRVYKAKGVVEYYLKEKAEGTDFQGGLCMHLMNCINCPSGVDAGMALAFKSLGLIEPLILDEYLGVMPEGILQDILASSVDNLSSDQLQYVNDNIRNYLLKDALGEEGMMEAIESLKMEHADWGERDVFEKLMGIHVSEMRMPVFLNHMKDFMGYASHFVYQDRLDQMNGDGPLMKKILNPDNDINFVNQQPSHQSDYLLGVLGGAIGLREADALPKYDWGGQTVLPGLRKALGEDLLKAYISYYQLFSFVQRAQSSFIEFFQSKIDELKLSGKGNETGMVSDIVKIAFKYISIDFPGFEKKHMGHCMIFKGNSELIPIEMAVLHSLFDLKAKIGESAFDQLLEGADIRQIGVEGDVLQQGIESLKLLESRGLAFNDFADYNLEDYVSMELVIVYLLEALGVFTNMDEDEEGGNDMSDE